MRSHRKVSRAELERTEQLNLQYGASEAGRILNLTYKAVLNRCARLNAIRMAEREPRPVGHVGIDRLQRASGESFLQMAGEILSGRARVGGLSAALVMPSPSDWPGLTGQVRRRQ